MKHTQSVTGDLDVCVTKDGELAIMVADEEGFAHTVKVPDMDKLISALRAADLIAVEVRQRAVERSPGGRCQVDLIHPGDDSKSQCTLPKAHLLDDTDHVDEHGHRAPVLVHQSTIRAVQAIQDARDAGLIE